MKSTSWWSPLAIIGTFSIVAVLVACTSGGGDTRTRVSSGAPVPTAPKADGDRDATPHDETRGGGGPAARPNPTAVTQSAGTTRTVSDYALIEAYKSDRLKTVQIEVISEDEFTANDKPLRQLELTDKAQLTRAKGVTVQNGENAQVQQGEVLFTDGVSDTTARVAALRTAWESALKKDGYIDASLKTDSLAFITDIRSGGLHLEPIVAGAEGSTTRKAKLILGIMVNNDLKLLVRTVDLKNHATADQSETAADDASLRFAWTADQGGDGKNYKIHVKCTPKVTCKVAEITLSRMNGIEATATPIAVAKMLRTELNLDVTPVAVAQTPHDRAKCLIKHLQVWRSSLNVQQTAAADATAQGEVANCNAGTGASRILKAVRAESFMVVNGTSTLALTLIETVGRMAVSGQAAAENDPGVERRVSFMGLLARTQTGTNLMLKQQRFYEMSRAGQDLNATYNEGHLYRLIDGEGVYLTKNDGKGTFTLQVKVTGTAGQDQRVDLNFRPVTGDTQMTGQTATSQTGPAAAQTPDTAAPAAATRDAPAAGGRGSGDSGRGGRRSS